MLERCFSSRKLAMSVEFSKKHERMSQHGAFPFNDAPVVTMNTLSMFNELVDTNCTNRGTRKLEIGDEKFSPAVSTFHLYENDFEYHSHGNQHE